MNSKKIQIAAFGFLFLLVVGLPSLVFLSQKTQDTRSRASASTILYFTPDTTSTVPLQKNIGDTVSYDLMINPGTNRPSVLKLEMIFDPAFLQTNSNATFAVNPTAFPTTIEGPILTDNRVLISVSIGSDTTKAIQTITKVGTLTFTTKAPTTTAPTVISLGSKTQVLSVGASDQATENVLSTTTPAYLTIADVQSPTATPTPTYSVASPTPTSIDYLSSTPTPSPLPTEIIIPTPTVTLVPTAIPTPTLTPPSSSTILAFTVFMHGVGNSGDNASPNQSSLSNKIPEHPTRDMLVSVYDSTNQLVTSVSGSLVYDNDGGNFKGTVNLGDSFAQDISTVKLQSPSHLRRLVTGIHTIAPAQTNVMPSITLVVGDANGDNTINIIDYNSLINCYSDLQAPVACTDTDKVATDFNDDGAVNQIDYNLFLREITVQNGS